MDIMCPIELEAFQEGKLEGELMGQAKSLMTQLKVKFKNIPETYCELIKNADHKALQQFLINFVNANSLEDVFTKK